MNRQRKFFRISILFSFSLLTPITLASASYSKLKISFCDKCEFKKTVDTWDSPYSFYKMFAGEEEKLKTPPFSTSDREKMILNIYHLIDNEPNSVEKLETFINLALKEADKLLFEFEVAELVNSKLQEKHYIENISFFLEILNSVRQKFFDKLRGIVSFKTLNSTETKTLFSLIKLGLTILSFTNKMNRLSSLYMTKTLPLPNNSIFQLQENLTNSVDSDLQFIFSKVDQIPDVNTQMPFFEKAVELSIQLIDLVSKDTQFRIQHI